MAEELKWSPAEASRQLDAARKFIDREMGQEARAQSLEQITLNLTRQEMKAAKKRFEQLAEGKDRITVNDIRRYFRVSRVAPWCSRVVERRRGRGRARVRITSCAQNLLHTRNYQMHVRILALRF